jgi:hypothetical protein
LLKLALQGEQLPFKVKPELRNAITTPFPQPRLPIRAEQIFETHQSRPQTAEPCHERDSEGS